MRGNFAVSAGNARSVTPANRTASKEISNDLITSSPYSHFSVLAETPMGPNDRHEGRPAAGRSPLLDVPSMQGLACSPRTLSLSIHSGAHSGTANQYLV